MEDEKKKQWEVGYNIGNNICIFDENDDRIASINMERESHTDDAQLLVDSANSYRDHFADPVAAAEQDAMGEMIDLLKEYKKTSDHLLCETDNSFYYKIIQRIDTILAKTKE